MTKYLGLGFMGFGALWLLISGGMALTSGPGDVASRLASIFAMLGAGFFAVGLVMFGIGLLLSRSGRQRKVLLEAQGVSVQATVTRVEPNYSLTVNHRPVYSIVEFTFTDWQSVQQRIRKTRLSSNLVTHSQIADGSQVEVKYMMNDPRVCGLVLTDPATGVAELAV